MPAHPLHSPGSRAVAVLVVAVLAVLVPAGSARATTPRWHHCGAYKVVTHPSGGLTDTTHLYELRVQRVSCPEMRHVLHGFFFGHDRPAGPSPSDGVLVGHWKVALEMSHVFGDDGRKHFKGLYSDTVRSRTTRAPNGHR